MKIKGIVFKLLIPAASACIGVASIGSQDFLINDLANAQSITNRKVQGFPWAVGQTWKYSQDLHGSINNALDFGTPNGGKGDVYSVDSGTVVSVNSCTIKIKRADGLHMAYHHVQPSPEIIPGKSVFYQTKLGTTSLCGGSRGHHVHYFFYDQSTISNHKGFDPNGFYFGDWQLQKERDSSENNGNGHDYVLKNGAIVACAGSTIQNDRNICTTKQLMNSNGIGTPPPVSQVTSFQQPKSNLSVSPASVDLKIEAANLYKRMVYWTLYRGSVGDLPPRLWRGQQLAQANSIVLQDLDGKGDVLKGVNYYSVVSLNQISEADAKKMRVSCYKSSKGLQLCDRSSR